jgi:hypothetical protein
MACIVASRVCTTFLARPPGFGYSSVAGGLEHARHGMISFRWLMIAVNVVATLAAVYLLRNVNGIADVLFAVAVLIYALLNLLFVILVHRSGRGLRNDRV